MSDADTRALIEDLQRSNRLWKRLALGLLAALGVAILLFTVSAAVQMRRAQAAELDARMQAEEAHRQEQEAKKRFEEARKAVDEFQRKGQQP
jgi:flagellar biosynthesis/type III secretory pathway M-ring protein FliF/YscJ